MNEARAHQFVGMWVTVDEHIRRELRAGEHSALLREAAEEPGT